MRSTGSAAPPSRASALARDTWRSDTSRSTAGGRLRVRLTPPPTVRRPRRSAPGELCRRLSDAVDDRLPLAGGLVQPARLGVVVDYQRSVVDPDQPRSVEGVAADHPLARFLRPHLVEDEVAVRVSNQVAVVDLNGLHPMRVVADDKVGAVVDGEVADFPRV